LVFDSEKKKTKPWIETKLCLHTKLTTQRQNITASSNHTFSIDAALKNEVLQSFSRPREAKYKKVSRYLRSSRNQSNDASGMGQFIEIQCGKYKNIEYHCLPPFHSDSALHSRHCCGATQIPNPTEHNKKYVFFRNKKTVVEQKHLDSILTRKKSRFRFRSNFDAILHPPCGFPPLYSASTENCAHQREEIALPG
jgi:hypothetical protein